jgi:large subunit ribosomal protein L23
MGLLDRWSKKTQTQRLEKNAEPKTEAKPAEVKTEKKTTAKKAEVKKTTAKKVATKKVSAVTESHEHSADESAKKVKKIINSVLLRALVTEKSAIKQSENKYSFVVANSANKAVIKKAVEEVYGVKPLSVNVINAQGKAIRFGNHFGKRSDFRKAIVTLPKGKSIVIHEGV